jgi:hypothetical protein
LTGLESLGELLIGGLELGSICRDSVSNVDEILTICDDLPSTICSISVVESLPTALEIVMLAVRPEDFSVAVTLRIPLTSTSKTTSRAASPALIGGIGASVNSPREVLSAQLVRSPW